MVRVIVSLLVLLLLILGAVFLLGGLSKERPTTRVEKAVELGNLAN